MASPGTAIDLSSSYGVAYWGFIVSAVLYGCIIVQGYIYFSCYPKDSWLLKSFVATMIILDGGITVLAAESFNYLLIKKYGDASVLLVMNDAILSEYILTWLVVTASQIFYASRVYIVNKKFWYIPAMIGLLALGSQAAIIVLFVKLFREHRLVENLAKREFVVLSCLTGGMSSAADIISTGAMCYFLASHRTGFRKTKQLIKMLIFYSVNRGVMVTVCQIAILVTFALKPTGLWWLPPHLCLSKFHVITLVALLNARSKMRPHRDDNVLSIMATDRTSMRHSRFKDKLSGPRFALRTSPKHEERVMPSEPSSSIFSYHYALSRSSDRSETSITNIESEERSEHQAQNVV
ncbi:hypothetical protein SCHPADRAFT_345517 [Schizopora paradoxa]|uniref:DUF6534 domain-containing protein n=1 Tax=Schizopora paradoxa TaxID=27342 RepID=A0A0H2SA67_9AGAM|nr:hypothetical protein SCHPADRAFT_345517 [Schizopora paradoxa]